MIIECHNSPFRRGIRWNGRALIRWKKVIVMIDDVSSPNNTQHLLVLQNWREPATTTSHALKSIG